MDRGPTIQCTRNALCPSSHTKSIIRTPQREEDSEIQETLPRIKLTSRGWTGDLLFRPPFPSELPFRHVQDALHKPDTIMGTGMLPVDFGLIHAGNAGSNIALQEP